MKIRNLSLAALVLAVLCAGAGAQETMGDESHVNKLLRLQQFDQVISKVEAELKSETRLSVFTLVAISKISELEKQKPLTEEQKKALHAAANSVRIPFDIAAIRQLFVDEYRRSFTSEELLQLIAFFETPLGRKTVAAELAMNDKLVNAVAEMQVAAIIKVAPQVEAAMDEAAKSFGFGVTKP